MITSYDLSIQHLADDVARHVAVLLRHGAALGPAAEVTQVEVHVEGLREAVEVHRLSFNNK